MLRDFRKHGQYLARNLLIAFDVSLRHGQELRIGYADAVEAVGIVAV